MDELNIDPSASSLAATPMPISTMAHGVVCRPSEGEHVCGDAFVIVDEEEETLLAVIDGVGHGKKAAEAAVIAKKYIENHTSNDLDVILQGCHNVLKTTRGAVIGIARVDLRQRRIQFSGIGNIRIRILSEPSISLFSVPGILGANVRKYRVLEHNFHDELFVLLHSDGISSRIDASSIHLGGSPQKIAEEIAMKCGKPIDDATVLISKEKDRQQIGFHTESVENSDERTDCGIRVDSHYDVIKARERAAELAEEIGFSKVGASVVALVVTELARNIVLHAGASGKIHLATISEDGRRGIQVEASDNGHGICNVADALLERNKPSKGLGSGLASVTRLMNDFRVETGPNNGTTIIVRKWLDP